MSEEDVARWAVKRRDEIKIQYKDMTSPDVLEEIKARNVRNYGSPNGPTIEQLRESGKTWSEIIESASRPGGRDLNLSPPGFIE